MKEFGIIAGPCSIDEKNIEEAIEIGKIPEVDGVRCVGLKSVTSPRPFMGIDKDWFFEDKPGPHTPPSVALATRIVKETGKIVAMEVMDKRQLVAYTSDFFRGRVFLWNPAIMQLGWPIFRMAKMAKLYGWYIGLKNPKWYGNTETKIDNIPVSNSEKVWWGNAQFVKEAGEEPIMIHRGFEFPGKEPYRNMPDHNSARIMKRLGFEVWLDPSHICGSEMRGRIVEWTLGAIDRKTADGSFLYSGILIEVGNSQTDTGQHITIDELKELIKGIKLQRGL